MRPRWKTTLVIWSRDDPRIAEEGLSDLAHQADYGTAFLSAVITEKVADPETDQDWNGGQDYFMTAKDG